MKDIYPEKKNEYGFLKYLEAKGELDLSCD